MNAFYTCIIHIFHKINSRALKWVSRAKGLYIHTHTLYAIYCTCGIFRKGDLPVDVSQCFILSVTPCPRSFFISADYAEPLDSCC